MVRIGAYSVYKVRRIISSLPQHAFDSEEPPEAPDYSNVENWSSHPSRPPGRAVEDANLMSLPGESPPAADLRACDCFFVHDSCMNPPEMFPFVGLEKARWNCPVNGSPGSHAAHLAAKVNEQVDWSVAGDASCFNGVCRIYAPRYRQGNVLGYAHFMRLPVVGSRLKDARLSFDLAYSDVRRAFLAFMDITDSTDRPFFLASHSQGTQHMVRLLQEEVEGHPQRLRRFVHGYLVGQAVPMDLFGRTLERIAPSATATDVCSVSCWRTARVGHAVSTGRGIDSYDAVKGWRRVLDSERLLANNPVTWAAGRSPEAGSEPSPVEEYLGAAFPVPDNYDIKKNAGFISSGVSLRLGHMSAQTTKIIGVRVPGLTRIECGAVSVRLSANDLTVVPPFAKDCIFSLCERDWLLYHDIDFPLFYGNVRKNVSLRLAAWQQRSRL